MKLPVPGPTPRSRLWLSVDKKTFAYVLGNELVCRTTDSLNLLWSGTFDGQVDAHDLALSANGSYLAVALADSVWVEQQRFSYTMIYDLVSERRPTRIEVNGASGLAISPDGGLIAVVYLDRSRKGIVAVVIRILDSKSGRQLDSVVHDEIKDDRRAFLRAGCQLTFTPDGKYLVSAGPISKVWAIER